MENENNSMSSNPNYTNPNNPRKSEAPVDPSNTSDIGQKVEQGVISKREGISEQSAKWEDDQESDIPKNSIIDPEEENLIKDPSPEEVNHEEREEEADKLMAGENIE
jgi:hypothetical protein